MNFMVRLMAYSFGDGPTSICTTGPVSNRLIQGIPLVLIPSNNNGSCNVNEGHKLLIVTDAIWLTLA
jgi:hypothetical protein